MKLTIIGTAAFVMILAGCEAEAIDESPDDLYALAEDFLEAGAPDAALEFYQRAALGGNARAMLVMADHGASTKIPSRLVEAVLREPVVSTRAHESALEALGTAGRNGDAEALLLAGLMTFVGYGITADSVSGREMLVDATDLGNAEASFWLGWTFENDDRYREAAAAYEQAISMGHEPALVELAMLHVNGRLVGESFARGMAMLRVAHERGDTRAGELFLRLLERTEQSAASGSALARERLSDMRLTGFQEVSWHGSD